MKKSPSAGLQDPVLPGLSSWSLFGCSLKWNSKWRESSFRVSEMLEPFSRAWFPTCLNQRGLEPGSRGLKWWSSLCMLRDGKTNKQTKKHQTGLGKKPVHVPRSPHPETYWLAHVSRCQWNSHLHCCHQATTRPYYMSLRIRVILHLEARVFVAHSTANENRRWKWNGWHYYKMIGAKNLVRDDLSIRALNATFCLVTDLLGVIRGSQLASRRWHSSRGATNYLVWALSLDHRCYHHFNSTIKSQTKSKRAVFYAQYILVDWP